MASTKLSWVGIFGIVILIVIFSNAPLANSNPNTSPWLVNNAPTLDFINGLPTDQPLPYSTSHNIDCQLREVLTRPKKLIPALQSKLSHESCVTESNFGAYSNSNFLQRPGSSVYGIFQHNTKGFVPIPRTSTGITLASGSSYGYSLYFWDNLDASLISTAFSSGVVIHKLPAVLPQLLQDKAGYPLIAEHNSISFSAGGDWMVVDIPFRATVRVNTKTREILPFAKSVNYNSGEGPAFVTAISPDGRYAFVSSKGFNTLKIYDLSTCGPAPDNISNVIPCNSRDLLPFMQESVSGFGAIISARFKSNYTLDIHTSSTIGNKIIISRYVLTASGQQATGFQYLALGDSFASGEGAYQYKSITDTTQNKCHLSQRSYPYLISKSLGFGQFESVGCSGAKIKDIINLTEDYDKEHSQSKGKSSPTYNDEIFNFFLPGYRWQSRFVEKYAPNTVTISVAGNDIGFDDILKRCLDTDTCYDSYEDRFEIAQSINELFPMLTKMYQELMESSDPRVKIYVIGYPQIADPNGFCDINVRLSHKELVFAQQLITHLNSVVKKAAQYAGVFYTDTSDSFDGYKLCETKSWNVAVNGLTHGNDIVNLPFVHGPIGNESFHPNAKGHELFKSKILSQTQNLTASMPSPDQNAKPEELSPDMEFLQAPKTNRVMRKIMHYTGTDGGVYELGKTWLYDYNPTVRVLKAGSKVYGWLKSDPVYLGEFTVNPDGSVVATGQLPNNIPAGFHTFHLYGKNTSDEDIDITQTIYVTDGTTTPCSVPSEQDNDQDGLDDSCDPFIDQPPVIIAPTTPQQSISTPILSPTPSLTPSTIPTTIIESSTPTVFTNTITEVPPLIRQVLPPSTFLSITPTKPVINILPDHSAPKVAGDKTQQLDSQISNAEKPETSLPERSLNSNSNSRLLLISSTLLLIFVVASIIKFSNKP